ncbi:MAG: S8 family serine peptidase [Myxococcaceae bacterium]
MKKVETMVALTTGHRFLAGVPLSSLSMTSEAAARAARLAADIWRVEPRLRPETVRGLIVHAASWTPEMLLQFSGIDDRLAACGYGVPDPVFARECAKDRATVLIEDEMPNAVFEEEPKKKPPKRSTTKTTEPKLKRRIKLFRLPIPEGMLTDADPDVELRVTLSYFAEPNAFKLRVLHGLDLKWDMQGPTEERSRSRESAVSPSWMPCASAWPE